MASGLKVAYVGMESGVEIETTKVSIGAGSYLNRGVVLSGLGRITIGERVAFGPQAMIVTSTHEIGPAYWRAGSGVSIDTHVTIGDGAWIGARATILPGVTVGQGCVIAAGAVVVKDCEANGLYAGVPARRIRDLPLT